MSWKVFDLGNYLAHQIVMASTVIKKLSLYLENFKSEKLPLKFLT